MVRVLVLSLILCVGSVAAFAQGKPKPAPKPTPKAAPKPAVPPRPVAGTTQLPGDNGKLGTTYTLGPIPADAVNFTLLKAEFAVGPVTIGEQVITAKKDQKLLVLHYTLHNPSQNPLHAGWETVSMTAVDAQDTNHPWAEVASRTGTTERLDFDLKPAQKVEATTVIVVPAKGVVPKLICQRNDAKPVLRYDMRSIVAPLPELWRDPADSAGATVRTSTPGTIGTGYTTGLWNFTITKVERGATPPEGIELEDGESIQWVHATLTNVTTAEQYLSWSTIQPSWEDNEGVEIEYNENILRSSRDERVDNNIAPGKSLNVRYYTKVPKGGSISKVKFTEPEYGRTVVYSISG